MVLCLCLTCTLFTTAWAWAWEFLWCAWLLSHRMLLHYTQSWEIAECQSSWQYAVVDHFITSTKHDHKTIMHTCLFVLLCYAEIWSIFFVNLHLYLQPFNQYRPLSQGPVVSRMIVPACASVRNCKASQESAVCWWPQLRSLSWLRTSI